MSFFFSIWRDLQDLYSPVGEKKNNNAFCFPPKNLLESKRGAWEGRRTVAYGFAGSRAVVRISQQLFRRGTIVEPPPVTDITPPVTDITPPVTDITPPVTGATPPVTDDALDSTDDALFFFPQVSTVQTDFQLSFN